MEAEKKTSPLQGLPWRLLIPLTIAVILLIVANVVTKPNQHETRPSRSIHGGDFPGSDIAGELTSPWLEPAKDANEIAAGIASEMLELGRKATDSIAKPSF